MESLDTVSSTSCFWDRVRTTEFWSVARATYLGRIWRSTRGFVREFWLWARRERVTYPSVSDMTESLAALDALSPEATGSENVNDAPIFLLATGWKTGSTLLQRILVTDESVLLWGEPLGEMAILSKLAETMSHASKYRGLREGIIQGHITTSQLATSWIATLFPPGEDLRQAVRSLFDRWLGVPARQRGFARWGLKEVRMGATEAVLLHWLYPSAKFVLLTRHPYDCYLSLSDAGWWPLCSCSPDVRVDSAARFARHWNRLTLSWSQLPADFPCVHLKYEDLVEGKVDFRELETWLGVKLREDLALKTVLGHTAARLRLGWHERLIVRHEAAAGMMALGYSRKD